MSMEKKIIVLAGSREEFERFLAANGLTDSEALYGWEEEVIRGISASRVVEIGTFFIRKDAQRLRDVANAAVR